MQLLWAVAHGLETISKRMGATVGVTGPQRLVVRLIGHFGQLSAGELAELLHVHPSSLTGVLRRLETANLIRRRRDREDGRRAVLTVTASGKALNESRSGTVESAVRRTLRTMSSARTATTREVLKELARELGVEATSARRR